MSDIHIERQHQLGLPRARQVANAFMQEAQDRWGLAFEHQPWAGEPEAPDALDRILFSGMGAQGQVTVSGGAFDVALDLGGLMSAFAPMVEEKMARKLDQLLAQESAR